jgi:hypothetical protein
MGEKFSVAQLMNMGDAILADIAVASAVSQKSAAAEPIVAEVKKEEKKKSVPAAVVEEKKEEAAEKQAEDKAEVEAEEAGKEAAAIVANQLNLGASNETVIDNIMKTASADAHNVFDYLVGFVKSAMEAGSAGDAMMNEASQAGAGAGPAAGAGQDAEIEALVRALVEAGVTPDELMALAQGGAQGGEMPAEGGEMPAAAAGEMPPEAMAAEAPKMASAKQWNDMSIVEKSAQLRLALGKASTSNRGK